MLPQIISFDPDSLVVGETLTLNGANFSEELNENEISFIGSSTIPNAGSSTQLEIEIPEGTTTGPVTVTVNEESDTSDETLYILADIPREGLLFFSTLAERNGESVNDLGANVFGAAPAIDRFDKPLGAYDFNGDGDYMYFPNEGLTPLESLTISLWVKIRTIKTSTILDNRQRGGYAILLGRIGSNSFFGAGISESDGSSSTVNAVNGGNPITDEWINLTFTYDGSVITLYQNKQQVAAKVIDLKLTIPTKERLFLGQATEENFSGFDGSIDDLAIYSRVLNAKEISQLYDQTVSSR